MNPKPHSIARSNGSSGCPRQPGANKQPATPTATRIEARSLPEREGRRGSRSRAGGIEDVSCGASRLSFRDNGAGAAHFFWNVLELGQTVFHRQHGLLIIDVHARLELKLRDN